jgi:hypothetical protein
MRFVLREDNHISLKMDTGHAIYSVCHLKRNLTSRISVEIQIRSTHPHVIDSPKLPCDIRVKFANITRPLITPGAQKLYSASMEYPRAERVFILEHYFTSKWFAAVRKAVSNA